MRKIVIRLSPIAKTAVTVAMVGAGLALYGKMQGVDWANGVGSAPINRPVRVKMG